MTEHNNGISRPAGQALDESIAAATQVFAALSNPTRLRIVDMLSRGECTVNEISDRLGILQPNASQHLSVLHKAAIVNVTPVGTIRYYRMAGPDFAEIIRLASAFQSPDQAT